MTRILLVIMSEDEERIRTSLNFAKNQMQAGNEITMVFWGPSEKALATNDQPQKEYNSLASLKPKACVNTAKRYNLEVKLSGDIGIDSDRRIYNKKYRRRLWDNHILGQKQWLPWHLITF
jgi:hypothetical protein